MTTTTYADQQAAILSTLINQAERYDIITIEELTATDAPMGARIALITPQVALEVLTKFHASNRQVSLASKDAYLRDMLAGQWAFNGQTMVFDLAGHMLDGQHRMGALAETVKTMPGFPGLPFVIVQGVDISAQETMDAGRKRSVADQLNIGQSDKIGTKIVAALRALYLLGNAGSGGKLGGGKLTNAMLFDMFRKHTNIHKSVTLAYAKDADDNTMQVRPAVVAAIHYAAHNLMDKGYGAKADRFVEVLRSGVPTEGYEGTDPAHALYVRWGQLIATGKRPSENDALKLIAYAWSMYADGKAASPKAFAKAPVVLEPIGFTRTNVTGEVLNLPVSSQPAQADTPAVTKAKAGNKLANGMTQKAGETEAQTMARYAKASAEADKKTPAKRKPKADKAPATEPAGEPEVDPEVAAQIEAARGTGDHAAEFDIHE